MTHQDDKPEPEDPSLEQEQGSPRAREPQAHGGAVSQDVDVDEQGEESFPASDPPANY